MKIRVARKVMDAVDGQRHHEGTLAAAVRRFEKTKSFREDNALWDRLMEMRRRSIRECDPDPTGPDDQFMYGQEECSDYDDE